MKSYTGNVSEKLQKLIRKVNPRKFNLKFDLPDLSNLPMDLPPMDLPMDLPMNLSTILPVNESVDLSKIISVDPQMVMNSWYSPSTRLREDFKV